MSRPLQESIVSNSILDLERHLDLDKPFFYLEIETPHHGIYCLDPGSSCPRKMDGQRHPRWDECKEEGARKKRHAGGGCIGEARTLVVAGVACAGEAALRHERAEVRAGEATLRCVVATRKQGRRRSVLGLAVRALGRQIDCSAWWKGEEKKKEKE